MTTSRIYTIVVKNFTHHCNYGLFYYFFELSFFKGKIIIQHKSLMTLKTRRWFTSLYLFGFFSDSHKVKIMHTGSNI